MSELLLTILVPTVPSRINYFYQRIMKQLMDQTKNYNNVEVISFFDNKKRTIGKKRDEMLKLAQGKYVTFVDDDDRLSNDYVDEIMNAITNNDVDCIVYNTETTIETTQKKVLCKYGVEYSNSGYINSEQTQWRGKPAHTMVWKSMIAKIHPFSNMSHGEDYDWVNRAYKDVKIQHRIDKILYYYDACYTTTSETANLSDEVILNNINKQIKNRNIDNSYTKELSNHWENCHLMTEKDHHFFLTGSSLNDYLRLFNCNDHYNVSNSILEIGIGEGQVVKEMFTHGKNVTTSDISEAAKDKIKDIAYYYHLNNIDCIPKNSFDIIFCHLVIQHIDNDMLEFHLKHFIPTLNEKGVYYIQYRGKHEADIDKNIHELCKYGDFTRDPIYFKDITERYNGIVLEDNVVRNGNYIEGIYKPWSWRVIKIKKKI
jgi:2-polyprenyl-3-methyl-5-hydroxy-6-metoxy-1,4-benzoquinol methylase